MGPETHLAIDLLDHILYAELVSSVVRRDGMSRIASHSDLVWLDHTLLTVLVEYPEGVALCPEDDADGRLT